jgi:hypothetical protein
MFVRAKRIGAYSYLYLVEAVRENGKTKQRIIRNLGRKEVVEAAGDLDRLARSAARLSQRSMILSLIEDGSTPNVASGPGAGGNDLLFFPELASAHPSGGGTTVAGSLTVPSSADGEFVVDFYSVSRCDNAPPPGGFGEGAVPIGSIEMPAASGPTTVPFTADGLGMVSVGSFVTATATDGFGTGNTSEFSACGQVADTGPEPADVSVSVINAPNPVTGGYDLGSTVTVTNQGPGDATGVTLTDSLPAGLAVVSASTAHLGEPRRK